MLRVIVVDDERLARQGIRQLLGAYPEISIVGEAGRVSTAAELIEAEKPDVVFLDIQMPGASGFDLLGRIETAPKVVFVTAHFEHAVRAFDVQAIDYLLKPINPDRLTETIRRLVAECNRKMEATVPYHSDDRVCLRTPERTVIARLADVIAMEADRDFTRFFIVNEAPLMVCRSLRNCEETFPKPPFVRISRSLLVNIRKVKSVHHPTRDMATLEMNGTAQTFEIGRRALVRLRQWVKPSN